VSQKRNAAKKLSLNLLQRDVDNLENLRAAIGRPATTTEVISRALALAAEAFVFHGAEYVQVGSDGVKLQWKDTFRYEPGPASKKGGSVSALFKVSSDR